MIYKYGLLPFLNVRTSLNSKERSSVLLWFVYLSTVNKKNIYLLEQHHDISNFTIMFPKPNKMKKRLSA